MYPDIVLGHYVNQKSKLKSQFFRFLSRYHLFTDVSAAEVVVRASVRVEVALEVLGIVMEEVG